MVLIFDVHELLKTLESVFFFLAFYFGSWFGILIVLLTPWHVATLKNIVFIPIVIFGYELMGEVVK